MISNKNIFLIFNIINIYQISVAFTLTTVEQLVKQNKALYQKIDSGYSFNLKRFHLSFGDKIQPYKGSFPETFVLTIPNGRVHSPNGWITIDNSVAVELILRHESSYIKYIDEVPEQRLIKVHGRVLVLAQLAYTNYYHFLYEILGRLSLLESNNIEYDWIYIPNYLPFMKDLLKLWGIDNNKIIPANSQN